MMRFSRAPRNVCWSARRFDYLLVVQDAYVWSGVDLAIKMWITVFFQACAVGRRHAKNQNFLGLRSKERDLLESADK